MGDVPADTAVSIVMSGADIARAHRRIAHEIIESHGSVEDVVMVGIHTRGAHIADRLARLVTEFGNQSVAVGHLDITSHRDDGSLRSPREPRPTTVPLPIDDRSLIVVDDVLYTGRSVRAGLDALSELGRARDTELAVLVDRGHRELPIRPNYVGKNIPTHHGERVTVRMIEEDGEDVVLIEAVR